MTDKQEGTLSPDTAPDIGRNNMMASRPIVKQLLSDKAVVKKIHLGLKHIKISDDIYEILEY